MSYKKSPNQCWAIVVNFQIQIVLVFSSFTYTCVWCTVLSSALGFAHGPKKTSILGKMSDSFLWVDAGHVIANLTLSGNCNVTSYTPSRSDRYFSMIESVLTLKEELDLDAGLQIQV